MLTIEIKVNNKLIGGAIITNQSGLAPVSNYRVEAVEKGSYVSGHKKDFRAVFDVKDHAREQTVWALVAAVADEARARRESGAYDIDPREREAV